MINDESQSPQLSNLQNASAAPPQQQQGNPLGSIIGSQAGPTIGGPQIPPTKITKQQVIAGLHHFSSITKHLNSILNSPMAGKSNIRPKLFDASASMIGEGTLTVPDVMNAIKSFPDEPLAQKKWVEQMVNHYAQAGEKLISDYIAQGPGPEDQGPEWSQDTHKDHLTGLHGAYKR